MFVQMLIMFGVHYGVFAPCEWNSAKGIAVVDAAV